MSENENSLNSSAVDLDESDDELASLITKAQSFKSGESNKLSKSVIGADATRKLLERQRDALRIDNHQLTQELLEAKDSVSQLQKQVSELQNVPAPPGRALPVFVAVLLGIALGYAAASFQQQQQQ